MLLFDINILVYAHREDSQKHMVCRELLEQSINSEFPYGASDIICSGFLRIVTHPRVFNPPSPLETALNFINALRERPNAAIIIPGHRHWEIFTALCKKAEVKGNLIPDAYLAAMAIESGSTWVTIDRDFSRFPGLDLKHPEELIKK